MNHKTTPDERFLIKVYQIALEKGNPCTEINYNEVARSIGIKETAIKNIVKHLAQANLVKKISETSLRLTERGCAVALEGMSG